MKQDARGINEEAKNIQKEIDRWKGGLILVAVALVAFYIMAFFSLKDFPNSLDAEKWGQFGDFLGGLMNPLVAFAAFFWLTQSVKLQKQELAETRAELRSAAEAQRDLVENGKISVRLAALTSLANAAHVEVTLAMSEVESIERNRPSEEIGTYFRKLYDSENAVPLAKANARIKEGNAELQKYRKMMADIFEIALNRDEMK